MIDIKLLQNNFDETSSKLQRKKVSPEIIDNLRELNTQLKDAKADFESARAKQKEMSRLFAQLKREKKGVEELQQELAQSKQNIANLQDKQREVEERLTAIIMGIPNIADDDVPGGADEDENVELKKVLTPRVFDFDVKEHFELAEKNGWIDFERGVKLAKSRFCVVYDMGARIERALINFMLDFNRKRGFIEVSVPFLVNEKALEGTGQLPKFKDDLFKIEDEDLYLIPTAEVPLTNLFQDEILEEADLPIKMTGYTSCFRKEAGSAGRDTRGMIRQHQFHKVELVTISTQEQSDDIFDEMVSCASDLLSELELPHRVVQLCTGDLGFSASKTVDLEVWLPGQGKYREISSISNTRDFQSRRAKIRYKKEKKNILAHTLNGSSLAVGRTLVAIMENNQNADGTITIPKALQPYL
ncbi:MAG: serine--tRNA ligase [Campylobacterota bacterium]|nr:serine--tRNA ligase [Campylobacterota bacterium]